MKEYKRHRLLEYYKYEIEKHKNMDCITHTMDEILLTFAIIFTFGIIYFLARKYNTDKSLIHPFFVYIDFFDEVTIENCMDFH